MNKLLLYIGRCFGCLGGVYISNLYKRLLDVVYTGFHAQKFAKFGSGKIEYPACQILGHQYISIGCNTFMGKNIILTAFDMRKEQRFHPQIEIGNNCVIGKCMHITAVGNIKIGNNVLTGRNCLITDNSHGYINREEMDIAPISRNLSHKDVVISDNVWIGENVCILPGVKIGIGAIIGAGSIVTKDVPDYCVAAGNPAKVVKKF